MIIEYKKELLISALFHDIGKFIQRGVSDLSYLKHDKLSTFIVESIFKNKIINFIVSKHHRKEIKDNEGTEKERILARIVCEADSLSSGERDRDITIKEQLPLESIFTKVFADNYTESYIQPFSYLNNKDYVFPQEKYEEFISKYQIHWDNYYNDLLKVDKNNFESLFYLSKKHLWCIPSSSWKDHPDISLHEHSKTTAAIACSMLNYFEERFDEFNIDNIENRDDKRYLLICLDITGIQNFIYNISHTGATKALKGRSFLIQQYLDVLAETLVSEKYLNLSIANILYNSGGKFYVLGHNSTKSMEKLSEFEKKIEKILLEKYKGDLSIVLSYLELTGNDFLKDEINNTFPISYIWDKLTNLTEQKKYKKFSSIISPEFFIPVEPSGDVIQCYATSKDICYKNDICEENFKEEVKISENQFFKKYNTSFGSVYEILDDDKKPTNNFISEEQFSSQKLGFELRNDLFAIAEVENLNGTNILDLKSIRTINKESVNNEFLVRDIKKLYLINDTNYIDKFDNKAVGWKFYGGTWALSDEFEELCEKAQIGFKRLGVLRMDVDNLGRVFKEGLGDRATISRIVQLSTMLDFFFSSYLNKIENLYWTPEKGIIEKKTRYKIKDYIQIIYSGGDDVFIIGLWCILPDLAIWVREKFKEFTCNNKSFTLSAGIYLFPSGFPLYKAAKLAGFAEDRAKGERKEKGAILEKNAICFLNTVMGWDDFIIISNKVKELYNHIEKGKTDDSCQKDIVKLSRSLLNRLSLIYNEYERELDYQKKNNIYNEESLLWSKWRWRACYTLSKFGSQYKEFKNYTDNFAKELFLTNKTNQDLIKLLNVIARWAEFLTRKE